jgi:hypothetical protein
MQIAATTSRFMFAHRGARPAPLALLVILCVAACGTTASLRTSGGLIELDNEWMRLYGARLEAERASAGSGVDFNGRLAQLSSRAESNGDATVAGDPASAVSFYRIAATAAWSAGAPRNTQVLPIRDKGAAACARLPNAAASQPRDCALIDMAPLLALLEERSADVGRLRDAGHTLSGERLNAAENVAGQMAQILQRLLDTRAAASAQTESFDGFVALTLTRGFCTVQSLVGRIANSMPPPELLERARSAARQAQDALRNATISTTCN